MKSVFCWLVLLGTQTVIATSVDLHITAKDTISKQAKAELLELLKNYDLKRYTYTREIVIESRTMPHSHPTLTLRAEEKDKPDEFLGTFIHEQMHWYWIEASPGTELGPRVDFKRKYPTVRFQRPEGSGDESSTYQHLGVCWLEYQGLIQTVGPERATKVLKEKKYYTWVYKTVLNDSDYIAGVMKKYGMDNPTGH